EAFEYIQTVEKDNLVEHGSARAIVATCLALVTRFRCRDDYYPTEYKDMFRIMNVPYDEIVHVREEVIRVMFPGWLFRNVGADSGLYPEMPDSANYNIPAFQTWLRQKIRYRLRCREEAQGSSSLTEKLDTLFGIRLPPDVEEGME
ncbi:MAG: hypothetical protein Q9183_004817, partial [Haloplaca sp. 2 TL-2023]